MTDFLVIVAAFLVLNVGIGLVRVARGPSRADRMLAAQLFGTCGVAVLLVLAQVTGEGPLRLVGLVFALLAVVVSVAFVKRGWARILAPGEDPLVDEEHEEHEEDDASGVDGAASASGATGANGSAGGGEITP